MNRRESILGLIALGTVPVASMAQPNKVWRIGVLGGSARPASIDSSPFGGFIVGMREHGYVEGKDYRIEWRFADGKYERLEEFAREFAQSKVDLILTGNTPAAHAAKRATTTIPIVMGTSGDPVGSGLIASLARPGGNVTGLSQNVTEIAPKYLELVRTVLPAATRVAVLINPGTSVHPVALKSFQDSAQKIGVQILPHEVRAAEDIDRSFAAMVRQRAEAVIVLSDALFLSRRQQIAEAALKVRLPSVVQQREYVEAGGLISYGQSLSEMMRRASTYAVRLMKGANAADLPVEQPTTFELIVNLKTARALGISIPQLVLLRADKVIE